MTKLTQQEIEKEREAFESWFFQTICLNDDTRPRDGVYITFWQRDCWATWLARAEMDKVE